MSDLSNTVYTLGSGLINLSPGSGEGGCVSYLAAEGREGGSQGIQMTAVNSLALMGSTSRDY